MTNLKVTRTQPLPPLAGCRYAPLTLTPSPARRGKIIVTLLVIAMVVGACCPVITERTTVRERIDTLRVKGDTVFLPSVSGTLTADTGYTIHDTILVGSEARALALSASPFTASLDTTVDRIGMSLRYRFPMNRWTVRITEKDTVVKYLVRDTTIVESHIEKVPVTPFWVYIMLVVLGLAGGGALVMKLRGSI